MLSFRVFLTDLFLFSFISTQRNGKSDPPSLSVPPERKRGTCAFPVWCGGWEVLGNAGPFLSFASSTLQSSPVLPCHHPPSYRPSSISSHLTHSTTPLFLCLIWENQHLNLQRADIEIKMLCLYQHAQCEEYFKGLKGIMYIYHVIPNWFDFLYSVKHKRVYLEKIIFVCTKKVNWVQCCLVARVTQNISHSDFL